MATLINLSALTLIGNMDTAPYSTANLRDGNNATNGYKYPGTGYCGVVLATPTLIDSAQIDSVQSYGFDYSGDNGLITLKLYARTSGTPANDADGTLLGQTTFTDSNSLYTKTVESSDKTTLFTCVWWRISNASNSNGASEMRFYSAPMSEIKKVAGVDYASIKKICGVAIADVKKISGIS